MTLEELEAILARLPSDRLERLAKRFLTPQARRIRRTDERDELIRSIASSHYGVHQTGRQIADAMRRDMSDLDGLRADSGQKVLLADLSRLLELNGGRVPCDSTVRHALAGV
ncbi:MAG TPA: hypothetical protein VJ738_05395 [Steroidobacteraceae bacterium]|nr:hypothetical protein [Steroidobacteraceae bacterium]